MFWIVIAILGGLAGSGTFAMGMAQMYPPFAAGLARRGYNDNPDLIAQVADLVQQRYKQAISESDYYSLMRQAGYDSATATEIYNGSEQLLTSYDYITIWRRGEITTEVLHTQLNKLGYKPDSFEHLKQATLYYPNPQDLVRFAVREVYSSDIRREYGLDDDFPDEFLTAAHKGGLSEDFARQYWASHWQLPSVFQGYEMFHRGIIDDAGLDTLFRTADIMPFWRERLKQAAYNLVTRVDLRRLYKLGIFDRAQVLEGYKQLGYSPDNAEYMTQFTEVAYAVEDEEQANVPGLARTPDGRLAPSRSMIISGYSRGLLTREEAGRGLADIGYPTDAIDLLLNTEDQKLRQDYIDIAADSYGDQYRQGLLTLTEFQTALTELGVPVRYMDIVIAREIAQAKRRVKLPTKADLDKWLAINLIGTNEYTDRMSALGYREGDIKYYIEEVNYDATH